MVWVLLNIYVMFVCAMCYCVCFLQDLSCGVVCVFELLFTVVCLLKRECVCCDLLCAAVWCVCMSSCLSV